MGRPKKVVEETVGEESPAVEPEKVSATKPKLTVAQTNAQKRAEVRKAKIAKETQETWDRVYKASQEWAKFGGIGIPYKENERFVSAVVLGGEYGPVHTENSKEVPRDLETGEMLEGFNLFVRVFSYNTAEIPRKAYNWAMYDEWFKTQKKGE